MAKIYTVTNRKGGVGKSTMSSHIAAGLAALGYNVGLVDCDSQGHAGFMLGMSAENGLYAAMCNGAKVDDVARLVPPENYSVDGAEATGNLWLLPSFDLTYKIPYEVPATEVFRFFDLMHEFIESKKLDIIIIDSQPTLTAFDGQIYMATDGFIYVTEADPMSIDGLQQAYKQMTKFKTARKNYLNLNTDMVGIIVNKMRPDTNLHRANAEFIGEEFKAAGFARSIFAPAQFLYIAYQEAAQNRMPVWKWRPEAQAAKSLYDLAYWAESRLIESESAPAV